MARVTGTGIGLGTLLVILLVGGGFAAVAWAIAGYLAEAGWSPRPIAMILGGGAIALGLKAAEALRDRY